ncbi:hypothetical protein [Dactylosporangium sp. CS-033363]|uniref:hypothetical protein n=1 Tax=Dactylosporangium sp. CS-033363 TaxID=3239935 RepID=UPI003D934713
MTDPRIPRQRARRGGPIHRCLTCYDRRAVVFLPQLGTEKRLKFDATPRQPKTVPAGRAYVLVMQPGRTAHADQLGDRELAAGELVLQLHECPRDGR